MCVGVPTPGVEYASLPGSRRARATRSAMESMCVAGLETMITGVVASLATGAKSRTGSTARSP